MWFDLSFCLYLFLEDMVESTQQERKTRAELKVMLNAYAEEQIAKWDTMTTYETEETKEKGILVKQDWVDGVPLCIAKMTAKGLTQEMVDSWYNDPFQLRVLNPKNVMTKLDDDDGHMMGHVKIATPMMVSERCMILTWYNSTCDDGSKIIMSST